VPSMTYQSIFITAMLLIDVVHSLRYGDPG